jgi:oxalate decarboxylase/phosphoglucose isomerase-like protein (cupin superfamily)
MEVATEVVPVGGRITDPLDITKPHVHPNSTQMIMVLIGDANVIIYQDNEPFGMPLSGDRKTRETRDIIIIPPNVPHIIENTGSVPLVFLTIYSPPVHAVL